MGETSKKKQHLRPVYQADNSSNARQQRKHQQMKAEKIRGKLKDNNSRSASPASHSKSTNLSNKARTNSQAKAKEELQGQKKRSRPVSPPDIQHATVTTGVSEGEGQKGQAMKTATHARLLLRVNQEKELQQQGTGK